jgi:selenocysteine-specific translation elongation factor
MTRGVTVAVVGALEVAKELGKKGTVSDVTMFNTIHDDSAITVVEPTQFPEKFPPLFTALAMGDHAVLIVPELSRPVAETIATLELSRIPATVVLGPSVGEEEVSRALKGGRLAGAPRMPLDLPKLRDLVDGLQATPVDGPVRVPIDHAFPVKGVGAVALGVVRRGTLRAHEKLRLFPETKNVEIRSIQVHDVDRKDAAVGERVGVALKGVEADELARGQTLAPDGSLRDGVGVELSSFQRCRYYRGDAGPGAQLHLSLGLQVVPAVVDEFAGGTVRVTTDRPVSFAGGDEGFLLDLSVPAGPRIFGRGSAKERSG